MNKTYSLASIRNTWELSYSEDKAPYGKGVKALIGAVSLIASPIISLVGALILSNSISNALKSYKAKEEAALHMSTCIGNSDIEKKLADRQLSKCDKKIIEYKNRIKQTLTKNMWDAAGLQLQVPQKRNVFDYLSKELPEAYWNDFSWDDFLKADLINKKTHEGDAGAINALEQLQAKLKAKIKQKEELGKNPQNIRNVIELKYIKNSIKLEQAKTWLIHGLFCLIPTGLFWDCIFIMPIDDKAKFEGKKGFSKDENLISAHNRLIKNDYLVPYMSTIRADC